MQSFTVHLRMMDIHNQRHTFDLKRLEFRDQSKVTSLELAQALSMAWAECRKANQDQLERRRNSGHTGLFAGIRQDLGGISRQLDRITNHLEGRPPMQIERDPEYGIDFVVRPTDPAKALGMLIPVNAHEQDPRHTYWLAGEVLEASLGVNLLE